MTKLFDLKCARMTADQSVTYFVERVTCVSRGVTNGPDEWCARSRLWGCSRYYPDAKTAALELARDNAASVRDAVEVTEGGYPCTSRIHTLTMIYTVDLIDGAAFEAKMCGTRAFSDRMAAEAYGLARQEMLREVRRADGETDEVFIEAIRYEVRELPFDDFVF